MVRVRAKKTTVTLANGTKVQRTTLVKAPVLEWRLQASAVRALRAMPEFGRRFTLAGDMAAARRSPQESVKMKATGLVPGEPDLRLYLEGGRLYFIEFKGEKGRESAEQIDRIALLDTLGFTVVVVQVATEEEAAQRAVELVRGWLPANDNEVV
jgi:hypothetical protein